MFKFKGTDSSLSYWVSGSFSFIAVRCSQESRCIYIHIRSIRTISKRGSIWIETLEVVI